MGNENDLVIRDGSNRIIALCVGMSQEDRERFIREHIAEGAHFSTLELKPGQEILKEGEQDG